MTPRALCASDCSAPCAASGWMARTISPSPHPGGHFTHTHARCDSIFGRVESGRERTGQGYVLTVSIPCNTRAEVVLTDGIRTTVPPGLTASPGRTTQPPFETAKSHGTQKEAVDPAASFYILPPHLARFCLFPSSLAYCSGDLPKYRSSVDRNAHLFYTGNRQSCAIRHAASRR